MKPITAEWVQKVEGDFLVATQIMRRNARVGGADRENIENGKPSPF